MGAVSIDRDARVPSKANLVDTKGWVRPRLWGGRAALLVTPKSEGVWESVGEKRHKRHPTGGATHRSPADY